MIHTEELNYLSSSHANMSKVCDKMQGCLISNYNLELLGSVWGIEGGQSDAGQGYPISSTNFTPYV